MKYVRPGRLVEGKEIGPLVVVSGLRGLLEYHHHVPIIILVSILGILLIRIFILTHSPRTLSPRASGQVRTSVSQLHRPRTFPTAWPQRRGPAIRPKLPFPFACCS